MRRRIDRYVESLLRRRRPKPFSPTEDDVAVARIAIELAAAGHEAQQPRESFINALHQSLAAGESGPQPEPFRPVRPWSSGRRSFLAGLAVTASTGVGAVAGHVLTGPTRETSTVAESELRPVAGTWQTVADEAELPDGAVLPFDLGAVTGFLHRDSGQLRAVSGICTHQGCRLNLHAPSRELACPCHGATFTLAGEPLTHPYRHDANPKLPSLPVRVVQGRVQVLAPALAKEPRPT